MDITSFHCPRCGRPSSEMGLIGHYEPELKEKKAFPFCAGETLRCPCGMPLRWIDMRAKKRRGGI